MTDRELLELAAKAAGLEITPLAQEGRDKAGHGAVGLYVKFADGGVSTCWNPLTDDGDALRLALKLGIQVGDPHQYGIALACTNGRLPWAEYWEPIKNNDYVAATRRAIVRAAAAIGKETP